MKGAFTVLLGGTFSHVVICMDFSDFCKVPSEDKNFSESAPLADSIWTSQCLNPHLLCLASGIK